MYSQTLYLYSSFVIHYGFTHASTTTYVRIIHYLIITKLFREEVQMISANKIKEAHEVELRKARLKKRQV